MKNVLAVVAASVLLLSACSSSGTNDASAQPEPAKNFCDAMADAAAAAPPAVDALDNLFSTVDAMSASAEDDLDTLHTAGTETVSTATAYADALDTAAELAPAGTVPDLETLSQYWTLYVAGLGQIAETATSYGSMVDQTSALQANETASALVTDQPSAQQNVNDSYIAECTTN